MSELAFLELVEDEHGDVVLRRSGADSESAPLVRLSFSDEAKALLGTRASEVARLMMNAGVQLATHHLAHPEAFEHEPRILH